MPHLSVARRALAALTASAAVAATMVAASILGSGPTRAHAADLSQFRAGNIVSDAVFFDSGSMNDAQIQDFLNSKVRSCQSGYTCLKSYRQSTWNRGADAMCGAYQAASNESSAQIIGKVARVCGISPRVLLVTLEKEQTLITGTAPSASRYERAMGFACPDTAPCDSQYFGLFNQIYSAAHQFKRYANPSGTSKFFTWYSPGTTATVQFNPKTRCGSSRVYIENQATANLYYYTPYQPNSAALRAGYGLGDDCSTYGNRNFFQLFTDWFGSTQVSDSPQGAIQAKWNATGGAAGPFGTATTGFNATQGGFYIAYQGGTIYWSNAARAAYGVRSGIYSYYGQANYERGALGMPVGDEGNAAGGGAYQNFVGGNVYWSNSLNRAFQVKGAIRNSYEAGAGSAGALGLPTSEEQSTGGGAYQSFAKGRMYWGANSGKTGTLVGGILSKFLGGDPSVQSIGFPIGVEAKAAGNGSYERFDHGTIYWNNAEGRGYVTKGGIANFYESRGGSAGALGLPLSDESVTSSGVSQAFTYGRLYWDAKSGQIYSVSNGIGAVYKSLGNEQGILGVPVSNETTLPGNSGAVQRFSQGSIYYNRTLDRSFAVSGAIGSYFEPKGGSSSSFGLPVSGETKIAGGTGQAFTGGYIFTVSGSQAIQTVTNGNATAYKTAGGLASPLGVATTGEVPGANSAAIQRFSNGSIYYNQNTRVSYPVFGAIGIKYEAQGGSAGLLKSPVSMVNVVKGGTMQRFGGGDIYASSAGKSAVVRAGILNAYSGVGGAAGSLGLPVADEQGKPDGSVTQVFEHGSIRWTAGGVTVTLS